MFHEAAGRELVERAARSTRHAVPTLVSRHFQTRNHGPWHMMRPSTSSGRRAPSAMVGRKGRTAARVWPKNRGFRKVFQRFRCCSSNGRVQVEPILRGAGAGSEPLLQITTSMRSLEAMRA